MIGIDLGTTRCKVSYVGPTGKPLVITNARGEDSTPTAVYMKAPDQVLVGTEAVEEGVLDPGNFTNDIKLRLGETENLLSNGNTLTPTKAAALVIEQLRRYAESHLNMQVSEVAATCPANFNDGKKAALLEAFQANGINVLRLLPEPTAAGIAYAYDKGGNVTVIVYDWGGGTFDVSIFRKEGNQIDILATEGIPRLGGNDVDRCILEHLLDELAAKFGERPDPKAELLFYRDLMVRSEQTKISLGFRKQVPVVVGYKGRQLITTLDQDWFHRAIDPFIEQTHQAVDKAVAAAGLKMNEIGSLVMVGGTSRLPYIKERIADHTGLLPKTDIDPINAISYGAALAAVAELAKQNRSVIFRGQVIPAPELFYQDCLAHAVGCCVVDISGPTKRLIQSVIIPKNTPIPCQKTDTFYLEREDQTEARIEILQGEPEAKREDCLLIGELVLSDLPKETKRTPRIQVEYTIDANGMCRATATDKISGKQQTVSVDYKKGIKPKDKPQAA